MRCRRQHQNTCAGVIRKGLCAKHRTEWEAMQADWDRRAKEAEAAAKLDRRKKLSPDEAPWTPQEDDILRDCGAWRDALKQLPRRTGDAIRDRRKELGVGPRLVRWTTDEDTIIHTRTLDEACALLPHRNRDQIIQRRSRIGASTPRSLTTNKKAAA